MRNIFSTDTYKNIFKKYLVVGEATRGDEVLVDMDEPMGEKISFLPGAHYSATCKAFATTTTKGRMLLAVYDIYGKFHWCYAGEAISDLVVKKSFGGNRISFFTNMNFGKLKIDMYVANRQFGTDLKNQKEHKELLIRNLEDISRNVKEEKAVTLLDERIESPKNDEDKIEYPVSELIKNAPKITASWGTFYEPLGMLVACHRGKEYPIFGEDKALDKVLLHTGNPESVKEGFLLRGDNGRIPGMVGKYKLLPKYAYYKEVNKDEIEYDFSRIFFAIYDGFELSLIDVQPDRLGLRFSFYDNEKPPKWFDERKLKEDGFEVIREYADQPWMKDKWVYIKRDVAYNDPKLKVFVIKRYSDRYRENETEEFSFL